MHQTPFQQIKKILPGAKVANKSEEGADTLVFLAEGEPGWDFPSGEYFIKRRVAKLNKQAYDAKLARDLWDRSERMISLSEMLIPTGCKQLTQMEAGSRRFAAARS
jgi:hypothetical protein